MDKVKDVREIRELKVGSATDPKKLAGSITIEVKEHNRVEVVYIGAGAGNVATKAIAIARGACSTQGIDLWSYPSFYSTEVEDSEVKKKVGMRLVVENKAVTAK